MLNESRSCSLKWTRYYMFTVPSLWYNAAVANCRLRSRVMALIIPHVQEHFALMWWLEAVYFANNQSETCTCRWAWLILNVKRFLLKASSLPCLLTVCHLLLWEEVSVGAAVLHGDAVAFAAHAVSWHGDGAVVVRQGRVLQHRHVPQKGVGTLLRLQTQREGK